jgi:hypothetical protein
MPYIENIVDLINTELQTTWLVDKRFAGSKYYGISETTYRGAERFPGIQLKSGEITPIAIDDLLPFTLWHRVDEIGHVADRDNSGFGDKDINRKSIVEARLFACVNRQKTQLNPNQFATLLSEGLPLRLTSAQAKSLDLTYVIAEPILSNLRSKQVYDEEFFLSDKTFVDSEMYMLVVRYRIEVSYVRGCLAACACE